MDADEDTYGFGSFSDLFDAGLTNPAKRLDLGALSRFFISERKIVRFQQQHGKRCVVFQHVAAKFNGVGIDGGLGALSVVPLEEGGGFLWLQTTQADSDARGRRKKELQDITNRQTDGNDHKTADALCIPKKYVESVRTTTLQNRAQGVEIKLMDGDRLEFFFMPGPFAKATHREEFLRALDQQTHGNKEVQRSTADSVDLHRNANVKRKTQSETEATRKETFRQHVRRYTELDPQSAEALAIAKDVYIGTGYYLGPTTKQVPKFLEDSEFRKKSMEKLANYLNRMKQEGKEADAQRELHTKAKHTRTKNNRFKYTDIDTGAQISPQTYEQRYLEYVKTTEIIPTVHELPIQKEKTENDRKLMETGDAPWKVTENARSVLMATLGIDISSSRVIDNTFFSVDINCTPSSAQTFRSEVASLRDAVDRARTNLWKSWNLAFAQVSNMCTSVECSTQSTRSLSDHVTMRKRPRTRRQSLVVQNFDDLQESIEKKAAASSQNVKALVSSCSESHKSRSKRGQDMSYKRETVKKARRTSSTQNNAGMMDQLPSETEEKASAAQQRSSQISRQSTQPKHRAKGNSWETSSLEMVEDDDLNLCQLCFSGEALVQMKPCGHTVCSSCWSRLSRKGSRRLCPWDREVVTKREQ